MKVDNKLQEHIFHTYINLRMGIAIIGFLLPFLLVAVGKYLDVDFQDSISSYFHADEDGHLLRTIFVGCLFAVGVALYLYKGYSNKENIALNLAGTFAVGVAAFPMTWMNADESAVLYQGIDFSLGDYVISAHGICAIFMFLCIAYVCIFCASDTLDLLKDEKKQKNFKRTYFGLGIGMILFPLTAALFAVIFQASDKTVFIIEAVAILTFVAYWFIKSREVSKTNAEWHALHGHMHTEEGER